MKKFLTMILVTVMLVGAFSTQAFAMTSKPSDYTTFVGGNSVSFSGNSKNFTFTTTKAATNVYLETRVYDPDAVNGSLWTVEIKLPKSNSYQLVAYVSSDRYTANYDYELLTNAPKGTYSVRVTNVYGASSSDMKSAMLFIWDN